MNDSSAWMDEIDHPSVPATDEWGDFLGWQDRSPTSGLPPVRKRRHEDGTISQTGLAVALRIEPGRLDRGAEAPDGSGLQVVHLNPAVIRLDATEPAPERVPRVETFRPLPVMTREQALERQMDREVTREWGQAKATQPRWMLAAAAGVIVVVLLAMVVLPLLQPAEIVRKSIAFTAEPPAALTDDNAAQLVMLKRESEAVNLFRRFAAAATHDDLLATVRDPEPVGVLVRPHPVTAWVPPGWRPNQPCQWECYSEQGRVGGILSGVLPDFRPFVAFMTLEHGTLKLDWKATTGYGTATFRALELGHGNAAEIRGFLKPSHFYTAALPESEYRSYTFISPDGEYALWIYARRSDRAESLLATCFAGGDIIAPDVSPRRFTLALAKPASPDIAANQWMLKEVLHKEWIRP